MSGMKPTHCAVCGTMLIHPAKGRPRVVCSYECRIEHKRRRWNDKRNNGPRPCNVCGEGIPPGRRRDALYCSAQCSSRARANREYEARHALAVYAADQLTTLTTTTTKENPHVCHHYHYPPR